MKIMIRSEIVVEQEVEMTPEEFRRAYRDDFGQADRWMRKTTEAKIYDKLNRLANVNLGIVTKVFIRENEHEHSRV